MDSKGKENTARIGHEVKKCYLKIYRENCKEGIMFKSNRIVNGLRMESLLRINAGETRDVYPY